MPGGYVETSLKAFTHDLACLFPRQPSLGPKEDFPKVLSYCRIPGPLYAHFILNFRKPHVHKKRIRRIHPQAHPTQMIITSVGKVKLQMIYSLNPYFPNVYVYSFQPKVRSTNNTRMSQDPHHWSKLPTKPKYFFYLIFVLFFQLLSPFWCGYLIVVSDICPFIHPLSITAFEKPRREAKSSLKKERERRKEKKVSK